MECINSIEFYAAEFLCLWLRSYVLTAECRRVDHARLRPTQKFWHHHHPCLVTIAVRRRSAGEKS